MPRGKTYLTPSEYAVLGLLRERPAHGYELQRQFAGKHGLARVCPIEPAMVYAILKSLSGLELIDGVWERDEYPPKAVYATTEEGDATFQRWLRAPVGRMREIRLDFLVKLYFALKEDKGLARGLLIAQADYCRDYEAQIEAEVAEAKPASFDAIVLGSKASAARLTRIWLEECLITLDMAREQSNA
jgi:DNA-binding PadR family transcriptional regulator